MNGDMTTAQWINHMVEETESALTLIYMTRAFNECAEIPEAHEKMKRDTYFWRPHRGSIQRAMFIHLFRLIDRGSKRNKSQEIN